MKVKANKKVFILKKSAPIICGEGSLAALLEIPHEGTHLDQRILLNILYPIGKKIQVISDNTMWLLRVHQFAQTGTNMSDSKFYTVDIHFYQNDQGRDSYLSVPSDWMETQ